MLADRRTSFVRPDDDWRYKGIAAPCDGRDVSLAGPTITQAAAQRADLNFEVALFDDGVRPYLGYQFGLTDELAVPVDQSDQEIERPTADTDRQVTVQKQPSGRKQPKRVKTN